MQHVKYVCCYIFGLATFFIYSVGFFSSTEATEMCFGDIIQC